VSGGSEVPVSEEPVDGVTTEVSRLRFAALGDLGMPDDMVRVISETHVSHLATLKANGGPIVDPLMHVPGVDGPTIDIGAGLSYPAKAERALRNRKVGLLFDRSGAAGEPLLALAAYATVLDSDLQRNTDRWVAESWGWVPPSAYSKPLDKCHTYFVRIYVAMTPVRAWWWHDGNLESAPTEWVAESTQPPPAPPAPNGKPLPSGDPRPRLDWREEAHRVLAADYPPPTLTMKADDGFPVPFRVLSASATEYGFDLKLPAGAPWELEGKAFLGFAKLHGAAGGQGRFLGEVTKTDAGQVQFHVERALQAALLESFGPEGYIFPPPREEALLRRRLDHELERRGASMPVINLPAI
jgi:hypothetical protein